MPQVARWQREEGLISKRSHRLLQTNTINRLPYNQNGGGLSCQIFANINLFTVILLYSDIFLSNAICSIDIYPLIL